MRPRGVILGIDPGTTGMGYAILDRATEPPVVLTAGVVSMPATREPAARLAAISDAIDTLIASHRPTVVALERLYFNRNARTAMSVAEARGVVLLCAARNGLEVAEYTPQEVKLAVTGTGGAGKRQVQRMLTLVLGLAKPISQDNAADAVAIALTHAHRSRTAEALSRGIG
jgi:crossover junction endodeoxyribonuclease RuvC